MTSRSLYDIVNRSGLLTRDQPARPARLTEEQLAALQRIEYETEQALATFTQDDSVIRGLKNVLSHVQGQIASRRPLRLYTFKGYRKVETPEQTITAGTGQEALALIKEQVPGLRVTTLKRVR